MTKFIALNYQTGLGLRSSDHPKGQVVYYWIGLMGETYTTIFARASMTLISALTAHSARKYPGSRCNYEQADQR